MGQIKITTCDIEGLLIIEPTVYRDDRGFFMETYNQRDLQEAGFDRVFVQDNQSMSTAFLSSATRRSFAINARIFTIPVMKAAWLGMIRKLGLNGRR